MEFDTVFDVLRDAPPIWPPSQAAILNALAGPACIIAVFVVLTIIRPRLRKALLVWVPLVLVAAAGPVTLAVAGHAKQRSEAHAALRTGAYIEVEGVVEGLVPMPYEGHAEERFTVGGVTFAYSPFHPNGGFDHTVSHGGPIREGQHVKIAHRDGVILRVQIARPGAIPMK